MQMEIWESILLGVMALGLIFWMGPGIKVTLQRSKDAPKDWLGALVPIGAVVLHAHF
jgi:uncharacterized membrane protein YhaH (DUF805 family)